MLLKNPVPAALYVLVFLSCNTRGQNKSRSTDSSTVWVCGNVSFDGQASACYWKNGQITLLKPSGYAYQNSYANSIIVDGGDVYIAGFSPLCATLWTNDKPVSLGNCLLGPTAIAKHHRNIYLTGNIIDSTGHKGEDGIFYKNGQTTPLPAPFGKAVASRLTVEGDDVYITGVLSKDTAGLGQYAVLWKNGVPTQLSTDTSSAQGIAIANGDVYIAGTLTGTQRTKALYWKNGTPIPLPSDSINSSATSIGLKGSDVIITGTAFNRRLQIYNAVYWVNGVQHYLTSPNTESSPNCLFIHNGDIYIGGIIARPNAPEGQKWQACYWKNGSITMLDYPGGAIGDRYVSGIFVTPN